MKVRVEEIMGQDPWQGSNGPMIGWNLRVTDENAQEDLISVNSTPKNAYTVGQEFDFIPNGQMFGLFKKGKRQAQGNYNNGGGYQSRPQSSGTGGTRPSNPQQAPKAAPTMSQAVAVLKECIDAAATVGGSDGHATTLFLARLRGDIVRDPSAEDKAKAAAAQQAAAQAAAEAAAKAAADAAKAAEAVAPGYTPAEDDDGGVPF